MIHFTRSVSLCTTVLWLRLTAVNLKGNQEDIHALTYNQRFPDNVSLISSLFTAHRWSTEQLFEINTLRIVWNAQPLQRIGLLTTS